MIRWTERSFSFEFPISMMPVLIERLEGTATRIRDLVKNLPEKTLRQKNGTDWSIKEHIGHLADLEELHEGRVDDFLARLPVLRAADMSNRKTYEAQHNEKSIEDLLQQFDASRKHFVQRIQQLLPEQTAMHPRLQKPMRVVDMSFFVAEHDDHHLERMRELSGNFISV